MVEIAERGFLLKSIKNQFPIRWILDGGNLDLVIVIICGISRHQQLVCAVMQCPPINGGTWVCEDFASIGIAI